MLWSPSQQKAFKEGLAYADLPDDLVSIDDDAWMALVADQHSQVIVAGPNGQPMLAPVPIDLAAYANAKQWALAGGGFTVTLNGKALTFPTDLAGQGLITGKWARLQAPNPPADVTWQFATGFETISAADFVTTACAVADFVQATFDALIPIFAGIASGAITTTDQVDQAVWPPNHN